MKIQTLNWKILPPLFFILCYWFYLSICCGYFLSKVFYNLFTIISPTSLSEGFKSIKFRNIIKIIIDNWGTRIYQKTLLFCSALATLTRAVKIFLKKFKSPFKLKYFKYNFRLLRILLPIFLETFLILFSLVDEIFFFLKIKDWLIQCNNLRQFLMEESLLITGIVYGLYLIFLGIVGFILGIWLHLLEVWLDSYRKSKGLSLSNKKDKIYLFLLLLLLRILYNLGFNNILFDPLEKLCLDSSKYHNIEKFSTFHSQGFEPNKMSPFKLFLEKPVDNPEVPFPILGDPFLFIDVNFLFEELTNYEFELFTFYLDVNQKIKS